MPVDSVGSPGLWIGFTLFVLTLLVLDLGVFHRKAHAVGYKEALGWSAVWVSLALGLQRAASTTGSGRSARSSSRPAT